jgi:hypothetical protein
MRLVAFVALTLACGGCSFVFLKPASTYGDGCSRSQALPIIDTFLVVGQVLGTIIDAAQPASAFANTPISRGGAIGINATAAVVHLSSAIYGYSEGEACREREPSIDDTVERRRDLQRRMREFSGAAAAPPFTHAPPPAADGGIAGDSATDGSVEAPPPAPKRAVRQQSDDE